LFFWLISTCYLEEEYAVFTSKERLYLENIKKRNHSLLLECFSDPSKEQETNPWDPIEKPMSVSERKTRGSIRRKMSTYAKELTYAFECGMLPEKQLLQFGITSLEAIVAFFKGIAMLQSIEERGDLEEIIKTKHIKFSSGFVCGPAGAIISAQAKRLREEFRAKDPELYDIKEREIDTRIEMSRQARVS
jgi:hypothetical protein